MYCAHFGVGTSHSAWCDLLNCFSIVSCVSAVPRSDIQYEPYTPHISFSFHSKQPVFASAGHSLGGGVAALATLLLREPGEEVPGLGPIRCVALGPAAVLSAELAGAAAGCVTSVVLSTDPVPRLSCYTVSRRLLRVLTAAYCFRRGCRCLR